MGVDIVLKATKVDGVYTADPNRDPTAPLPRPYVRRGDRQEPEGDGRDRARTVPRPEHAAQGVLDPETRCAQTRRDGRGRGHARPLLIEGPKKIMSIADTKKTAEQKMGRSVDTLKNDYQKVRTGRALPGSSTM